MPGVSTTISGLPFYYVRGAPPGNVGYFLDGVRIPLLFHAFLGPSVVHPELLEQVELHPGPYPATYGRYAGAIVAADLRNSRRELNFRAELGLTDSGGYVETPFADGKGNFFVGGRYSYLGAILSALLPQTIGYWNYQTLLEYELTPEDKLGLFVFGAYDYFEDQVDGFFGTEFHRADLRYDKSFSADTSARLAFTLGTDRTSWSQAKVLDHVWAGRGQLSHRISERLLWRTGFSVDHDDFDLDLAERPSNAATLDALFSARSDSALGGFTELVWRPNDWVTVVPGARVDVFASKGESATAVDPRLAARFRVNESVDLVHAVGIAHQIPNYIPNVPGARVAGLDGGLQTALQSSAGVEADLPENWSGVATVFQNVILDVSDPFGSTQDFALNLVAVRERPRARSYGFELSLRRPLTRRLGAMLSYTLSRSTRSFPADGSEPAYETLAGYDRTHVLSAAGMYTFGPNWRLGARGVAYSGVPGRTVASRPLFDQARGEPFFRVDGRLERRFRIGEGDLSVVAELLNATFSREVLRRECVTDAGRKTCSEETVGPIFLPNLRVEASF
jgi:outer membrane receptor protein involved in Fe transport